MPRIVFGDNHLFGINHLSIEKAEAYRSTYESQVALSELFTTLRQAGINEQMMSNHTNAKVVLDIALQQHKNLILHPVIPYAHAINDEAAARGLVRTAASLLKPTPSDSLKAVYQLLNPRRYLRTPRSSIARFVEKQLEPFRNLPPNNRGVLFLNNVFTDLLIGLGLDEWFELFPSVCHDFGYLPGFITYNPTHFLAEGFPNTQICIHYNHVGYLVNLSSDELRSLCGRHSVWAMGVFGSGAYREDIVIRDLLHQSFSKVVFASSRHERIKRFSDAMKADYQGDTEPLN